MKLARATDMPTDRRDLVYRHGRVGGVVTLAIFAAPCVLLIANAAPIARGLPTAAWLLVSPVVLLVALAMLVILHALTQIVVRSLSAANWHARVRSTSVDFNLRSYQNSHFPDDAPTIVRIEFGEIASVRRVTERWKGPDEERDTTHTRRWLEFELRDVDTSELASAIAFERDRSAPQTSFLGMRTRGRFQHVPVMVTEDGHVRALDISSSLRKALRRRIKFEESRAASLDFGPTTTLDGRLRALIARGETIAAVSLVRSEMKVSLGEAKDFVDDLREVA